MLWLRVAVLALLGVAAAGCSDSARFDSNPYASNDRASPQETTGSISSRPAYQRRVEAQPLPAPSRPATVAANGGVADWRAGPRRLPARARSDVTGSVPRARAAPAPAGHWTWDGGSPVTVSHGETVETHRAQIRRAGLRHPARPTASATAPAPAGPAPGHSALRFGQRRPSASAARSAGARRATAENVHIVEPGESLIGIAHKHGVSLTALARANNIQPYAKSASATA